MSPLPPTVLELDKSAGTSILSRASAQGVPLRADCGGKGLCGKCRITVDPPQNLSSMTEAEYKVLSTNDLASGIRLACQATATGKVTVSVPADSLDTREVTGKDDLAGSFPVDPMIRRLFVDRKPKPTSDDLDVVTILRKTVPILNDGKSWNPEIFRDLSAHWSEKTGITLVKHQEKGITAILAGARRTSLGFAVDVGTTTVAAYLCDMSSGKVLGASSSSNPQRRCGEDVISRIAFAGKSEEGMQTLQRLIAEEINGLFEECLRNADVDSCDVDEVVLVGNTTMQHLFCGINPRSIGGAPYLPVSREACDWRSSDLGLNLNPATNVHVFPVISGFVGGDTVAAILWDQLESRPAISLIVDIGTNGEIVLCNGTDLWATSCATGPAFEGAHISSGMRAVSGAIDKVRINPIDLNVSYDVLGSDAACSPRGICGSGIIDAVAEMRRAGLILQNGRLNEAMPGVICDSKGVGRRFTLVPASSTATGSTIEISLADIRQIQVAKAALEVGIRLIMSVAGVHRVDRLVLTGAFGARFNWKNAAAIGMLPPSCIPGTVETVANSAGLGAVLALLDKKHRERAAVLAERVQVLELAEHPDFPMEFPMAMEFPPVSTGE